MSKVYFVDDETHILSAIKRVFADEPIDLVTFEKPAEALDAMRKSPAAVVVTDQKMPGMQGTEFLEKIKDGWPDTVRIIMSGYADLEIMIDAINRNNIFRFINKPSNNAELVLAVKEAIKHYQLTEENKKLHAITKKQNEELFALNHKLEEKVLQKTEKILQDEKELKSTLKKLKQALEGSVQAMALAVETRDPYTAGHQKRVAELAYEIGKEMGLSQDMLDGIRMAGLVHDLGKIYVPAEILNRPGILSRIELDLIYTHPQVGYDILKGIDFPWPISQIVLQHHERLDGSGYPQQLKGNCILLEAKIIAVADVVEAMSSHRPYRPARGVENALGEIERNKEKYYDVAAVEACICLFRDRGYAMDNWEG